MSKECGNAGLKGASWATNAPDRSQADLIAAGIIKRPTKDTPAMRNTEPFVRRWDLMSGDAIESHFALRAAARIENYVVVPGGVDVPLSRRTW